MTCTVAYCCCITAMVYSFRKLVVIDHFSNLGPRISVDNMIFEDYRWLDANGPNKMISQVTNLHQNYVGAKHILGSIC